MLRRKMSRDDPYFLCDQIVTVYREKDGKIIRTVYERAFLDFRKNLNVDKSGSWETNSFLLVIPGEEQAVFVNDRVLLGKGPEITDAAKWKSFLPSSVPGLVVVKFADPKYLAGKLVHTEAGG